MAQLGLEPTSPGITPKTACPPSTRARVAHTRSLSQGGLSCRKSARGGRGGEIQNGHSDEQPKAWSYSRDASLSQGMHAPRQEKQSGCYRSSGRCREIRSWHIADSEAEGTNLFPLVCKSSLRSQVQMHAVPSAQQPSVRYTAHRDLMRSAPESSRACSTAGLEGRWLLLLFLKEAVWSGGQGTHVGPGFYS